MVIETVGALEVPVEEIEVGTKVVEVETAEEVREVSKVVEVMVIVIVLTIKMVWNMILTPMLSLSETPPLWPTLTEQ